MISALALGLEADAIVCTTVTVSRLRGFFLGGTEWLARTGQILVLHFKLFFALPLAKTYITSKTAVTKG